jgi:enterochelin esterase family protein
MVAPPPGSDGAAGSGGGAGGQIGSDGMSGGGEDAAPADAGNGAGDVATPADTGSFEVPPGFPADGDFADPAPYNGAEMYTDEQMVHPGVPMGTITGGIFASTVNYPGATCNYTVYVPKQYDGTKPVALMVFQDGALYGDRNGVYRTPTVLDNLISKGVVPVMIAVFVTPIGNRAAAYDTPSDKYAKFLVDELLPAVVETKYKITADPEGRGIGGQSSGGVASFSAGWWRPDKFRRLLTDNSSFPNNDKYMAMKRFYINAVMTEPVKPLRVSLYSSTNDIGGLGPEAWLAQNTAMAAAMKARGYHYRFISGKGAHYPPLGPAHHHAEILTWLWEGYVPGP